VWPRNWATQGLRLPVWLAPMICPQSHSFTVLSDDPDNTQSHASTTVSATTATTALQPDARTRKFDCHTRRNMVAISIQAVDWFAVANHRGYLASVRRFVNLHIAIPPTCVPPVHIHQWKGKGKRPAGCKPTCYLCRYNLDRRPGRWLRTCCRARSRGDVFLDSRTPCKRNKAERGEHHGSRCESILNPRVPGGVVSFGDDRDVVAKLEVLGARVRLKRGTQRSVGETDAVSTGVCACGVNAPVCTGC
jgi:hypothetical protein